MEAVVWDDFIVMAIGELDWDMFLVSGSII